MSTQNYEETIGQEGGREYKIEDTISKPLNDTLLTTMKSRIKRYSDGEIISEIVLESEKNGAKSNYAVIQIGMTELGIAPRYAKIQNSGGEFDELQMGEMLQTHMVKNGEKTLAFDPYLDFCKSCEDNLKSSKSIFNSNAICWLIAGGKKHLQDYIIDREHDISEDKSAGTLHYFSGMNDGEIDDIFWFLEKKLGVDIVYKSWTDSMG